MNKLYERALEISRDIAQLQSIGKLLNWDQNTYLPSAAAAPRAEHLALLAKLSHDSLVSDELHTIIEELHQSPELDSLSPQAQANIRELRRDHLRQRRIPSRLVDEMSRTVSSAREPWLEARANDDFQRFAPWLEKLVGLSREVAQAVGFETEPYDALLDDYESGLRARDFVPVVTILQEALRDVVAKLAEAPRRPDSTVLQRKFDAGKLRAFARRIVAALGFDFDAGRMDAASYSFCAGVHVRDVRLVAGFNESNPLDSLFATIHEAGHGLYHQGIREDHWGTPVGRGVSLGVHESQARWWENFLARSPGFWHHFFPLLQSEFPESLRGISCDSFYDAISIVRPSLIRVEADEVTYNLHVGVRIELERALINDEMRVSDLPNAWNDLMEKYVGIRPQNNRDGVLQDVHWSQAMFGYFPTYTLGNLYAAQLNHQLREDIPDLDEQASRGEFSAALEWMRVRIHGLGALSPPAELISRACGEPLSAQRLIDYLREKFFPVYGL
jgi:carboxypeptidase Taq